MAMQDSFTSKLYQYIVQNNPDLIITLLQEGNITAYLNEKVASVAALSGRLHAEGKPAYIIEELCMEFLTKDLRPSKFNYLKALLEEEFEADYERFRQSGVLIYEVLNLITVCSSVFETLGFTDDKEYT